MHYGGLLGEENCMKATNGLLCPFIFMYCIKIHHTTYLHFYNLHQFHIALHYATIAVSQSNVGVGLTNCFDGNPVVLCQNPDFQAATPTVCG